ncbi:hypothetical protein AAMO2058_000001100 [Amorphochlora amoebiformis]
MQGKFSSEVALTYMKSLASSSGLKEWRHWILLYCLAQSIFLQSRANLY